MFIKAGAVALALLLASRVLGLVRESAQAAVFGASGLADVAVLMLTLPDWITSLLVSGGLAYVLLPAWAGRGAPEVGQLQRSVARWLLVSGAAVAAATVALRTPLVAMLAPGLPDALQTPAATALVWSALALPAAMLAALWVTRLQHEGDVAGMYTANLVVNIVVIASIAFAPSVANPVWVLGPGLLAGLLMRLAWLAWRQRPHSARGPAARAGAAMPGAQVWLWAALSAGLPLALPFVARSAASQSGAGALATFNYAWKLVELPLVLAIQLVAALAFPAIARSMRGEPNATPHGQEAVNSAFALAWTLACAAAAGLLLGAPALAQLLFGWGRMDLQSLELVSRWGAAGAWGLLPQALVAVALTVLATQSRLGLAVCAHALALAVLVGVAAAGLSDGYRLMQLLNILYTVVATVTLASLGMRTLARLPWHTFGCSFAGLLLVALAAGVGDAALRQLGVAAGLAVAAVAGLVLTGMTWLASPVLRQALRR